MQRFFRVSGPAVHQMVVGLDKAGLISRQPGMPRSIRVLVDRSVLPELQSGNEEPVETSVQGYSRACRQIGIRQRFSFGSGRVQIATPGGKSAGCGE